VSGAAAPPGAAPGAGPLARAAELELRLAEARRAQERAERARADAEVALTDERRRGADRERRLGELRAGLLELAGDLDALRAALVAAADEDAPAAPPGPALAGDPARLGELARDARELLASGRLDAADEVIRGLESAASRLREDAAERPA
jgi:hypothetical protein